MNNELISDKEKTYHFIGIGGISMSALAHILLDRGYKVSGSDITKTEITSFLEEIGCNIQYKQVKENIKDDYIIVLTDAIADDNPELLKAKELNLKIIHRAELLSMLSNEKSTSIAVTGSHGKTTATTILSHLLTGMNADPTCIVGGIVPMWESNYRIGEGDLFVYEACEAFNNFRYYHPDYLIVTSIDADHLDTYENIENITKYFVNFINKTAEKGIVILNIDDENIKNNIHKFKGNIKYYSANNINSNNIITKTIKHSIENDYTILDIKLQGEIYNGIKLPFFGEYNIQNFISSLTLTIEILNKNNDSVSTEKINKIMNSYIHPKRRFEYVGEFKGAKIFNDYAHHPKEIKVMLETAKIRFPDKKITAIFEPHLYSRTQAFFKDFAKSLSIADRTYLIPIYPAREKPIKGVSSELIYKEMTKLNSDVVIYNDFDMMYKDLLSNINSNHILITIGAGTIGELYKELIK